MSYDIWLTIDTGGPEHATVADVGNYTSNVSPMWATALGEPLANLHGQLCSDCIPLLESAVAHMRDEAHAALYESMNPPNGWGRHASATEYLATLLTACQNHPKATITISH